MSHAAKKNAAADAPEVVKWYTQARRFPQLIGKTPSGGSIWGGPYTYTQVAVGVGLIVVGSKTTSLWGHFGLIGNAVILFGATYAIVVLVGRLPIGSRNPLAVAMGAMQATTSPAQGRLGGRPVRPGRVHRARSRVVITTWSASTPAAPEPTDVASATAPRMKSAPCPAPAPQLSGVQRLLASSGAAGVTAAGKQ